MIIQTRTISVTLTCAQNQTSKRAPKILILQKALKFYNHKSSQGAQPLSNRNASNDKNVTKKRLFLQFWFLLAFCVQLYTRTTVITNNSDDQEARAPSIRFCQPIEMYNLGPGEIKGFCLASCFLRSSSNLFMKVMK